MDNFTKKLSLTLKNATEITQPTVELSIVSEAKILSAVELLFLAGFIIAIRQYIVRSVCIYVFR